METRAGPFHFQGSARQRSFGGGGLRTGFETDLPIPSSSLVVEGSDAVAEVGDSAVARLPLVRQSTGPEPWPVLLPLLSLISQRRAET